jgi:hypothetical protein
MELVLHWLAASDDKRDYRLLPCWLRWRCSGGLPLNTSIETRLEIFSDSRVFDLIETQSVLSESRTLHRLKLFAVSCHR